MENATGTTAPSTATTRPSWPPTRRSRSPRRSSRPSRCPIVEYAYTLRDTGPNAVTIKRLGPNGNQITSYELYDGRLRLRQTQTPAAQANGGRNVVDLAYDRRGMSAKSSTFWNSAAPADTLVAFNDVDVLNQQRLTYDNLGRATDNALWSANVLKWDTVTHYDGDRIWIQPPAGGTVTMTLTDARGHTTELRQYTAGTPASSTPSYQIDPYAYDRLGRLDHRHGRRQQPVDQQLRPARPHHRQDRSGHRQRHATVTTTPGS